jgi:hypothetical protein
MKCNMELLAISGVIGVKLVLVYGCGNGQFREHHGIALDSLDNVYTE